jgi:tRNA pseudouridine38-40 synthase
MPAGVKLQRIAMVVEFDGSEFHGWQRQQNAISAQAVLEGVLTGIEQQPVKLTAAGRTDAGVHAEALLLHADVDAARWHRAPRAYTQGVNRLLPDGICVSGVRRVAEDFHARFDCLERRYRYRIWNRTTPSAIHRWRHWWMPCPLDLDAMQEASAYLLGEHDFSAFRASGCQASNPVRELRHIGIDRHGWEVNIDIHANAFLYHMVRNIVGTLVAVGRHRWLPAQMQEILKSRERTLAGATAPAHGLYFTDALYDAFSARDMVGVEGDQVDTYSETL